MKICKTCGNGATPKTLDAIRPRKPRKTGSNPPVPLSASAKAKKYATQYLQRFKTD